jgi:predicted component of type VI protein secretion system
VKRLADYSKLFNHEDIGKSMRERLEKEHRWWMKYMQDNLPKIESSTGSENHAQRPDNRST